MKRVFGGLTKDKRAAEVLKLIRTKRSQFWEKQRVDITLELFHLAAERVPAYKDFLKHNSIHHKKIKTFSDFQLVPPVTKKNYLNQYPLEMLVWDGTLRKRLVLAATLGSTGKPFYFPRNDDLDWQSSVYHQMFLQNDYSNRNKKTLVIVAFGAGVWIGGIITYQAFRAISHRGYPFTIITTGPNKKEIFESLKNMGSKYDQVIICGYPPFIKDVIDEAKNNGVNLRQFNIKTIFAAEAFSEKFRDYVAKKAGIKNKYKDTMNIYGSADLGTMAEETPFSILVREMALKNKKIYEKIFHDATRIPTLAQFNPLFINFEGVGGKILCTGNNALPLVKYDIGDRGGVWDFHEVEDILRPRKSELARAMKKVKIQNPSQLPFVYVYERTDFSTKLYGAIIYAEHIKEALQHHHLKNFLTGKFIMSTEHDKKQDEYLQINIELMPNIKNAPLLKKRVCDLIIENLLQKNAEYRNNYALMPDRVRPKVEFFKYEHPHHFKAGIKQAWVKTIY